MQNKARRDPPHFVTSDFWSMALRDQELPSLPQFITRFKQGPRPEALHPILVPSMSSRDPQSHMKPLRVTPMVTPTPPYHFMPPPSNSNEILPSTSNPISSSEICICSSPSEWGIGGKWIEPFNEEEARTTLRVLFNFWMPSSSGRYSPPTSTRGLGSEERSQSDDSSADEVLVKSSSCRHQCCSHQDFCFIAALTRFKGLYPPGTNFDFKRKAIDKGILKLSSLSLPLKTESDIDLLLQDLGEKTRDKVREILRGEGSYWRTTAVESDERQSLVRLFSQVWGVGPVTALNWVNQGYRSIKDVAALSAAEGSGSRFTRMQQVGLLYFDDLQKRIPRDEVREVEEVVQSVFQSLMDEMPSSSPQHHSQHYRPHHVRALGSVLGGKLDCSDIDILISPSPFYPHISPASLLKSLLSKLINMGLLMKESPQDLNDLVDKFPSFSSSRGATTLSNIAQQSPGQCATFSGLWKTQSRSSAVVRRIDIKAYTPQALPCAVLYFSSSTAFNRAIKLYAIKHPNARQIAAKLHPGADHLRLSDVSLVAAASTEVRDFIHTVQILPVENETAIFQTLGLSYVPPHMRHNFLGDR